MCSKATLAELHQRCLKAEHVGEVLAKEAELGASKLEACFLAAAASFAHFEQVCVCVCVRACVCMCVCVSVSVYTNNLILW